MDTISIDEFRKLDIRVAEVLEARRVPNTDKLIEAKVDLGGEVRTGAGSRVAFELKGKRVYLHRPHPGREEKKYQVEEVREFLRLLEVAP